MGSWNEYNCPLGTLAFISHDQYEQQLYLSPLFFKQGVQAFNNLYILRLSMFHEAIESQAKLSAAACAFLKGVFKINCKRLLVPNALFISHTLCRGEKWQDLWTSMGSLKCIFCKKCVQIFNRRLLRLLCPSVVQLGLVKDWKLVENCVVDCPVSCVLSDWSPWGECSHTCGNQGKQTTKKKKTLHRTQWEWQPDAQTVLIAFVRLHYLLYSGILQDSAWIDFNVLKH